MWMKVDAEAWNLKACSMEPSALIYVYDMKGLND